MASVLSWLARWCSGPGEVHHDGHSKHSLTLSEAWSEHLGMVWGTYSEDIRKHDFEPLLLILLATDSGLAQKLTV